jgi:integrase
VTGSVFKVCRDGKQCPRLRAKNHGSWAYVVDVGKDEKGRRKQRKRAGFATKAEAQRKLEQAVGDVKAGRRIDDKRTVGEELDSYLKEKTTASGISAAGRTIRPATTAVYRLHIGYLKAHLGGILLTKLTAEDISRAYRAIMEASAKKVAEHQRRQAALNELNARQGLPPTKLPPVRAAGTATLHRVHSCLRAALNVAVRSRRLAFNPALGVELPPEQRAPVAPWEAAELGQYLDFVQGHRLAALFEVLAFCGLRRGEALGLMWSDIDFERGQLVVRRQLLNAWENGAPTYGEPKTANGRRIVELDSTTLGNLLAHRLQQDAERALWATAYEDFGLVFTQENGRPLDPSRVTKTFGQLAASAGLRHIRLHDLRHGSASLMLAAGIPVEVVSKRLGHSSINLTMDTYSHLLEGVGRRAAEAAMGLVPRSPKAPSDPAVTTS